MALTDTVTDIRAAVADADIRVLLMCVYHLSGDRKWLEPPYRPARDIQLIAEEDAGLPPEIVQEIRDAAVELAGREPVVGDPGDELMVEMMSVCAGEPVPPEYATMMREEIGFCSRDVTPPDAPVPADFRVLVVGLGASGIAMAVRLGRLGIPYDVVERRDAPGGVWYANRYPGCGVDTPNHAYSFSFTPPNDWSRFFAPQAELEDYLQRTAADFGVLDRTRFRTEVTRATWDEATCRWQVVLRGPDGTETRTYSALISAIGQLNDPKVPDIAGMDDFDGPIFHSQHWPDDLDVTGLRVAVVGTGASSMQIVPAIADRVGELRIFQRSPQWVRPIPRYHEPIPDGSRWLFDHLPYYAAWFRCATLWRFSDALLPFLHKDPEWPHPDRSLNRGNERHREQMRTFILEELADRPDLVDKCMPDYPPYGKRILMDNGWYEALRKPGVHLVTDGITEIDATGITTADGTHHDVDVIVLATGFHVTEMAAALDITGRDGNNLRETWADDNPTAHLGITVPGYPNLFCMQGPNTGLGHGGSAIFQSECQARYISGCLAAMVDTGVRAIDVRKDVHDAYVARVDAEHEDMIWTHPGMSTYYRNRFGRVVSISPWRLVDYWDMTHDPDLDEYLLTH